MAKATWALVTGASGGIGLDLARLCAEKKINVVLASRNGDKLAAAARELEALGVSTKVLTSDLSKPGSAAKLHKEVLALGIDIEILINNAGVGDSGPLIQSDVARLGGMLQLNMTSLAELTRLFCADLVKRGGGKILNVASVAAFQPVPYMAAYAATKSFVLSFSEAVGEELRGSGVTVTCLAPGATATGFAAAADMVGAAIFKKGATSDSITVAREGFAAMMAGKRLVVVGAKNRLMTAMVRFSPRSATLKIARQMMAGEA